MKCYLFEPEGVGIVKTPFNLEAILASCPALLAKWKERPFYFDVSEHGDVVVVYINPGEEP